LVLEWLKSPQGQADRQLLRARGLLDRFLRCLDDKAQMDDYPLRLLEPIFSGLKPERTHVAFASDLSVRFLRLRKDKQPHGGLSAWQWSHAEFLLEAFGWLQEQVVRQSPVLLHSRGITRYKATHPHLPPDEYRARYREAEADLERALELAQESGQEH